ncbi:DUF5313 family protein [Actinocrispum wychmicini]|uniref:DUF5313 domain-containing protein n=1 Tax=Actinocrispum wychmicini TaxID=1213861 RepID=A0A4R2JS93_9PSEU|nr:DUF5313 family protein [Actinocrispum wychmicini]TCO62454.1 hypothetical protein EV192_102592 [Actinocrispum wychmicini]
MAVKRPNPLWWLWYAFGGKLPNRYREWVLHDATAPTWLVRHVLRRLVFMAPILSLLYLLLAVILGYDVTIVLLGLGLGIYAGVYYALIFSTHSVDTRVTRHGYPDDYASQVRRALKQAEREAKAAEYNRHWRQEGET